MYAANQDCMTVLAGVWPPCCATFRRCRMAHALVIHAVSHVDHQKRVAWVSISMHASGSLPIVMVLRFAAHEAAGINPIVPKFGCFIYILFQFKVSDSSFLSR